MDLLTVFGRVSSGASIGNKAGTIVFLKIIGIRQLICKSQRPGSKFEPTFNWGYKWRR